MKLPTNQKSQSICQAMYHFHRRGLVGYQVISLPLVPVT